MSAKNRNGASKAHDRYLTPTRLARAAFEKLYERYGTTLYPAKRFLEPGAGPGTFCRLVRQYGASIQDVVGVELHDATGCVEAGYKHVRADFLKWEPKDGLFDLSVCNPPFTHAEAFIRHNLELMAEGGLMLYLCRVGLLGSITRRALWNDVYLKEVWLCRPRPSFTTDGGSDASEYAFFLIQKSPPATQCDAALCWMDW